MIKDYNKKITIKGEKINHHIINHKANILFCSVLRRISGGVGVLMVERGVSTVVDVMRIN